MAYYTDMVSGTRKEIADDNYTDDADMLAAWEATLERQPKFEIAVSDHLSHIGKLPISIKERVDSDPELQVSDIS